MLYEPSVKLLKLTPSVAFDGGTVFPLILLEISAVVAHIHVCVGFYPVATVSLYDFGTI